MSTGPSGAPPPLPRPSHEPSWRDHLERISGRELEAPVLGPAMRVAAAFAAVVALGAIAWWMLAPRTADPPLEASLPTLGPTPAATHADSASEPRIIVHVAGAVARPGLVEIDSGSRVADAVLAAGGATEAADLDRLNLALPVSDADRVYVPEEGETIAADLANSKGFESEPGPLDINKATEGELQTLPGIGPAIATAIVEHRSTRGPFSSVASLEAVPGIGPAKLERLRDHVTVAQ